MRGGHGGAGRPEKIAHHAAGRHAARRRAGGRDAVAACWRRARSTASSRRGRRLAERRAQPNIGWLFADPTAAAKDYYRRTGIFPIMHLVGVRRALVEQHPWLPGAVLKAFSRPRRSALAQLADTSATKVTLPFMEEQLTGARDLMGADFWPYGIAANRKCSSISCASTTRRACRRGWSRSRSCFTRRRTRRSRSSQVSSSPAKLGRCGVTRRRSKTTVPENRDMTYC